MKIKYRQINNVNIYCIAEISSSKYCKAEYVTSFLLNGLFKLLFALLYL